MKRRVILKGDELRRDALIAQLGAARKRIIETAGRVSPQLEDEIFLGEWTVGDLIAHLIGWDYTYIAAIEDLLGGQRPAFYALYDADWAGLNWQFVRQYGEGSLAELLESARQSHRQLLDFLQTIPTGEFEQDHGVRHDGAPVTITGLLQAEVKDEKVHYQQLQEWLSGDTD